MRFMMLMIPKGYESAPPGVMPDAPAFCSDSLYFIIASTGCIRRRWVRASVSRAASRR
jgi:hypothetical protein